MSTSVCDVCGMYDTYVCNGDASGCSECHSIEGGFTFIDDLDDEEGYWAQFPDMVEDENGYLYLDDYVLDGPIACLWEAK